MDKMPVLWMAYERAADRDRRFRCCQSNRLRETGRNRTPIRKRSDLQLANGETVIVRPSGTEPKIKVYYTTLGKDLAEAEAEKEKLAEALKPILA
mgnify:CR=1 FL=1